MKKQKQTVEQRTKQALASIGFTGKKPCGCDEPKQDPAAPPKERLKNTVE